MTTTRYYTPRARLTLLRRRMLASPFADHLRAAYRSAFYPAAMGAGVLLGITVVFAMRGHYVSWDGFQAIPAGGVQ